MTANNYRIGNTTSDTTSGTIGNSTVAGYIQLWGTNTAQNGAVLFGTAAGSASEVARFNQHGLTFSRNDVAQNALDDYEEGTFTPTLQDATSYQYRDGHYQDWGYGLLLEFKLLPQRHQASLG